MSSCDPGSDDAAVAEDGSEISLFNRGIRSLKEIRIHARPMESFTTVRSLSLHFNNIKRIQNLESLVFLRHLDLSSNEIECIEGLESLVNLCTLNLASNRIAVVQGLRSLRHLSSLNVSNNRIHSLGGLRDLWGDSHALVSLDLHGNAVSNLEELGTEEFGVNMCW